MGYPKSIEAEEKWALKKDELERKTKKNSFSNGTDKKS